MHAARPEWGRGEIVKADSIVHEGKPAQSLLVRFDRVGLKTLSTAIATLTRVNALAATPDSPENEPAAVTPAEARRRLSELPESATDPFQPAKRRLAATLDLYRYSDRGASLLDWASLLTGLRDPLTLLNRHELEEQFKRFQMVLDGHLRKILRDAKREDPAGAADAIARASPEARQAVRRCDAAR